MRKPLLLIASVLFTGASVFGQFTEDSFAPIGTSLTMYVLDSTATAHENETGQDVVWDYRFTPQAADNINEISMKSKDDMSYASDYPNSTYAFDIENYLQTFMNNDASAKTGQGFIFPDPSIGDVVVTLQTNEAVYMEYPMNLGDEVTDDYAGTVIADGNSLMPGLGMLNLNATGNLTAKFDGIGTLRLPGGNYTDVYRYKLTETASASIPLLGAAVINRVQYEYYDFTESKLPIFIHSTMSFNIPTVDPSERTVVMSFSDPNDPGDDDDDDDEDEGSVGISTNDINKLAIYPNPAQDQFTVSLPSIDGNASVSIIDNLGKVVYTTGLNSTTELIDISSLSNGVYFVNVTNGTEKLTQKLIVR